MGSGQTATAHHHDGRRIPLPALLLGDGYIDTHVGADRMSGNKWVRIPLHGDVEGIVLLLPDKPLSAENWAHFMRVLEAMRPALMEQASDDGGGA